MGIATSNENQSSSETPIRLSQENTSLLLQTYSKHRFMPIIDRADVNALFSLTFKTDEAAVLSNEAWNLFHASSETCHTLEILAVFILLCDGSWAARLDMLYDLFKGIGNDEIERDDIVLMVQSCVSGLAHVFREAPPSFDTLQQSSEAVADAGFIKLEKEIDAGLTKMEFVQWAQQRFRESKTVSSVATLLAMCEQT